MMRSNDLKTEPGATTRDPLVFQLAQATNGHQPAPVATGAPSLGDDAWQALAGQLARERTLTPFPARTLRERWEGGLAAILVKADEIAAYVSCAPVLDANTRAVLRNGWEDPAHSPSIDVYESLSGWTAPAMRQHGVSLVLRRALLARVEGSRTLFIGFTAGLGASPVLSRLGWRVLPWRDVSYVGSLIENSTVDCTSGVLNGWRVEGLKPYDEPAELTFTPEHDWNGYCHFWLSKPGLARELNAALARLNDNDLCRWRDTWGRVVEKVLLRRGWVPIVLGG